MHVLDMGGLAPFWRTMRKPPKRVTVVNISNEREPDEDWLTYVRGDACDPPQEVTRQRYDLVFSTSLIEHVGGIAQRAKFASLVNNIADRHWIQTPYRYFPVEPHWLFPGFQFLPLDARARLSYRWPMGHQKRISQTRAEAFEAAAWVELVGISEMRALYPSSEIWFERFGGLVKSLTAIRTH